MSSKAIAGLALAALCANQATVAHAGDPTSDPLFTFNGFGTLGAVRSNETSGAFTLHALQKEGSRGDWSAKVDTRLGGQVTLRPSPQWSAVVQAVVEQRHDGEFRPALDWATLKYQVTPDLSVRAGRIILPLFLYSDNYKVGYAQHWLRAPVEVYRLIPLTSTTGVDVIYRFSQGSATHTLQLALGEDTRKAPEGGKVHVKDGWLISDTVEIGDLTLHATAAGSSATIEVPGYTRLFDGFRAIAQGGASPQAEQAQAILDKYEPINRRTTFYGIGAGYDCGKWFVISEAGQVSSRSVFGKRFAWYATGGYRFGKFVPYLTYIQAKARSPLSDPGVSGGPAQLNAGLNTVLAYVPEQNTISLGARWDFARNVALKMQYDRTRIAPGSFGTLQAHDAPAPNSDGFNAFSISLDWVF